jgi:glycerophosphoryl diester phosphodiesterase
MTPTRPRHHFVLIGIVTLLALASANPASASACYTYPCGGSVDAVAHRGDSQYYPDNSFAAIQSAVDKGADWVEIDVHWNEPSQRLIVIHDSYLMEFTPCAGYSVESTPVYMLEACIGRPIAYFDDLLAYWTPRGFTRWMIELKSGCAYPNAGCNESSYAANRLTYALYLLLNQYVLHEKVWVSSFDHFMLQDLRGHRNGSRYPRLMKIRPLDMFPLNNVSSGYLSEVKSLGYQAVAVDMRTTSPNSVTYAHSIGLLYATWANGSYEAENQKAMEVRPDFHITDRLDHMLVIRAGTGGGGGDPEEWECTRYSKTCG